MPAEWNSVYISFILHPINTLERTYPRLSLITSMYPEEKCILNIFICNKLVTDQISLRKEAESKSPVTLLDLSFLFSEYSNEYKSKFTALKTRLYHLYVTKLNFINTSTHILTCLTRFYFLDVFCVV